MNNSKYSYPVNLLADICNETEMEEITKKQNIEVLSDLTDFVLSIAVAWEEKSLLKAHYKEGLDESQLAVGFSESTNAMHNRISKILTKVKKSSVYKVLYSGIYPGVYQWHLDELKEERKKLQNEFEIRFKNFQNALTNKLAEKDNEIERLTKLAGILRLRILNMVNTDSYNDSIRILNLSTRTTNVLERAGIKTIKDVIRILLDGFAFSHIRQFGVISQKETLDKLLTFGAINVEDYDRYITEYKL